MSLQAMVFDGINVHQTPSEFLSCRNPDSLRLVSYNVQVGIKTRRFQDYLTKSWQHFLPSPDRKDNLDHISELLMHFDLVALQEVDGGSLRTNFVNQVEYLARRAGMPYWYQQRNRNLGLFAQHSNGMLSRQKPHKILEHTLPGKIPGRGAIEVHLGHPSNPLVFVMMHLALGRKSQNDQLAYISELTHQYPNLVLMGDLNTSADRLLNDSPLKNLHLKLAFETKTYPSWRPYKGLDHILVSQSLKVHQMAVLDHAVSDHLPVAMEIDLPPKLESMNLLQ